MINIKTKRPDAPLGVDRTVDTHNRLIVAMAQREQLLQDPAGQTADPLVNQVNPNRSNIAQADLHGWQQQVIDGAIFKPRFSSSQVKAGTGGIGGHDPRHDAGSTGTPGTAQFDQGA